MIRHLMAIILVVIMLCCACIIFFTGTSLGTRILLNFIPGEISYQTLKGSMLTNININKLQYQSDQVTASIDQTNIRIKLQDILHQRINIEQLHAQNIQITLASSPNTKIALNAVKASAQLQLNKNHTSRIQIKLTDHSNTLSFFSLEGDDEKWQAKITSPHIKKFIVKGTGSYIHPTSIQWHINIKDFSQLIEKANGQLSSHGNIRNINQLSINATAHGEKLRWQQYAIHDITFNAQTDENYTIISTIEAKNINVIGQHVKNIHLDFAGTLAQHTLNSRVELNNLILFNAQLSGQTKNKQWLGNIEKASIFLPNYGVYQTQDASQFKLTTNTAQLKSLCLYHQESSICSQINWEHHTLDARVKTQAVSLSSAAMWLDSDVSLNGKINSALNIHYHNNKTQGQLQIKLPASSIDYHIGRKNKQFSYQDSEIDLKLNELGLTALASMKLAKEQPATISISLPGFDGKGLPQQNQAITGDIHIHLNDLSSLALLHPAISSPSGTLNIDAIVAGSLENPSYTVNGGLSNGSLDIIPLGISISDIQAMFTADHAKQIDIAMSLNNKGKTLKINGNISQRGLDFPMQFNITAKRFNIMDTNDYKLLVSPDLLIKVNGYHININGTLDIPLARFTPTDFSSTTNLPKDVVYIDVNDMAIENKKNPWLLFSDTKMSLDKIEIDYKGLNALIAGKLHIITKPSRPASANGKLIIKNGSYSAYGQNLTIEPGGSLQFTNDMTNPIIKLKASKKISLDLTQDNIPSYEQYLIVGVATSGPLQQPIINFYSNVSSLSQEDIMSYLIFGYSSSQLNNTQSAAIFQAVNAVGSGNSGLSNIQQDVRHSLGLSQLGLSSTTTYNPDTDETETGTSFVIGKNITDKLSASYSVGLLIPVNVLYLRYQLNRRWAVQSDSSSLGNGGDLIFSINVE